jgi:3-oxoacyl-[acyl-carrier protein] reductase
MSNNNGQKLAGKVAVVTGGSRAIGAAITKRLAAERASVAFTYAKGADAAASVVKEIERSGGKAIAIQADAANADAVKAAVEKAVATQAALKQMQEGGRIISIGSVAGERVAAPGLVPYAATKGAVKMFTQALAREIGSRGITVKNVQPGPIETDLNPATGDWALPQKAATALNRYGHVDEIAAMVRKLAQVPEKPIGKFGRPLFQSMTYHDTPSQPMPEMRSLDASAKAGETHSYSIVIVNSFGLRSEPSGQAR